MSSFTRPYARAFLEAAPAGYDVARFLEAGETMARAIAANPELRAFLLAPNVPREAKSKAVDRARRRRPISTPTARVSCRSCCATIGCSRPPRSSRRCGT